MKNYQISDELFSFITGQIFGFFSGNCILTSRNPFKDTYKEFAFEIMANYPEEFENRWNTYLSEEMREVEKVSDKIGIPTPKHNLIFCENFTNWIQLMKK